MAWGTITRMVPPSRGSRNDAPPGRRRALPGRATLLHYLWLQEMNIARSSATSTPLARPRTLLRSSRPTFGTASYRIRDAAVDGGCRSHFHAIMLKVEYYFCRLPCHSGSTPTFSFSFGGQYPCYFAILNFSAMDSAPTSLQWAMPKVDLRKPLEHH